MAFFGGVGDAAGFCDALIPRQRRNVPAAGDYQRAIRRRCPDWRDSRTAQSTYEEPPNYGSRASSRSRRSGKRGCRGPCAAGVELALQRRNEGAAPNRQARSASGWRPPLMTRGIAASQRHGPLIPPIEFSTRTRSYTPAAQAPALAAQGDSHIPAGQLEPIVDKASAVHRLDHGREAIPLQIHATEFTNLCAAPTPARPERRGAPGPS